MTYLAPRQGIFAAIVLTSLVLHLLFFAISTERSIAAQNQAVVDRSIATLSQELAAPLSAYDRVSMSVIMEPYAKEEAIGYVGCMIAKAVSWCRLGKAVMATVLSR